MVAHTDHIMDETLVSTHREPQGTLTNEDSEQIVIGTCLKGSSEVTTAVRMLSPLDFTSKLHQSVFTVIERLHKKDKSIDVKSVKAKLSSKHNSDSRLAELSDVIPVSLERHCNVIIGAAVEKFPDAVKRLALQSPLEYDKSRKSVAKELGVRVSVLDSEVGKLRTYDDETLSPFEDLEPWLDEINGIDLLNEIREIVQAHLVVQKGVDVAISIWTLLTYCYNDFRILPLLGVTSPEKRCGKTTCAEILSGLVFKAVPASNISSAVLYRIIEKYHPTMLVDEADTFLIDNDELRGVFNAGHTKKSAFVWRCNSETNEPEKFSVWGCKVVLMIGDLPDTMKDRAIPVRMRRKAPGESVKKMTLDFDENHQHVREKCLRWAEDNSLVSIEPVTPNVGNDRATDNWLPLLVIADKVGGDWPELARSAMLSLEKDEMNDKESAGQMLLVDIKKIFKKTGGKKISSENMIQHLNGMEDRPWCEWKRGNPITKNTVSRLLKPYGIKSKFIRFPEKPLNGYLFQNFEDSFKRYLPSPDTLNQNDTTLQHNVRKGCSHIQNNTETKDVLFQNAPKVNDSKGCSVVLAQNPDIPWKGKKEDNFSDYEEIL